jgi:hypothetical protein
MDKIAVPTTPGSELSGRVIPLWSLALMGALAALLLAATVYQGLATLASDAQSNVSISPVTQVNDSGQVAVSVTLRGTEDGASFEVAMNTHTVDLDGYDLSRMVVLMTDDGREAIPLSWDAPQGGHHRTGVLAFSGKALDDKPLIGPSTRSLTLTIWDVADVHQRSFTWALR